MFIVVSNSQMFTKKNETRVHGGLEMESFNMFCQGWEIFFFDIINF